MKTTGILLVGYSNIDSKIATEVARMAFPKAMVKTAATFEDALASSPIADTDLLVLCHPGRAIVERAMAALDSSGLPRWAVLSVDSQPAPLGAQNIAPEEWAGPVTSHAFRSAIAQHTLRRELARAQGDLTAIGVRLTHDLRTQVASILATAELTRELLQEIEPDQTELYQPIFDSVDSLGKLIERISFVTRASTAGTARTACDMKDAVNGALTRLNHEIVGKKASIVQPHDWPQVKAAKHWLEKIWLNLLTNALTHTGECPQIELGWKKEKTEYRFWIRDRGRGVAETLRSQLFEPFHLLHRTGAPRGLGLPIIRRLSELQGGRCGYEVPQDGGAEFFFTVPI